MSLFGNGKDKSSYDRAADREIEELENWRQNRFRILVCVDGSEESYEGLRFAAEIGRGDECDIILLYVRPIDQGLRTGGLQVRVARENMLDWGLELPGIKYLQRGLEILVDKKQNLHDWTSTVTHTDLKGDPLGDNKVEYRHDCGKSIVLKLKTAPDTASGILDQYELGPYNLMILGEPSRWQGEISSFLNAGVAQKVAMLAPCSTLICRGHQTGDGHLICTDGSERSYDALRRAAVLADYCSAPITLMSVATTETESDEAKTRLEKAGNMLKEIDIAVDHIECPVGNPEHELIKFGREHALIVVSDSGKSRFKRFLKGSTAFGVMGRASTSVLNVR